MNFPSISLFILRLTVSYIWLSAGLSKLFNNNFISTFPKTLENFAKNSPFDFYSDFLNQNILPHATLFAQLTIWGEILTGVAFLLGFPMLVAVSIGAFMNLNYFFVATAIPSQFLNLLMIASQLSLLATDAGKIWGLETKVTKKG